MTHTFNPHPKYPWFCKDCGYAPHEPLKHRVSDEHPEGRDLGLGGDSPASAVTAGQTPHPSPVDYTEVVERANALLPTGWQDKAWTPYELMIRELAQVIEAQAAELRCRDALIKDHLGKIMHLENRVDEEAHRAETAEARIAELEKERDEARKALHLFREFVLRNVNRWNTGINGHPIWLLLAETVGTTKDIRSGPEWAFIQGDNREPPSFLSTGGDSHG